MRVRVRTNMAEGMEKERWRGGRDLSRVMAVRIRKMMVLGKRGR